MCLSFQLFNQTRPNLYNALSALMSQYDNFSGQKPFLSIPDRHIVVLLLFLEPFCIDCTMRFKLIATFYLPQLFCIVLYTADVFRIQGSWS